MKIDTIKGLATYGTAAVLILLTVVIVALLTFGGQIDGATGVAFFSSLGSAAAGFLFASELARSRQSAYQQGLDTPTPNTVANEPKPNVLAAPKPEPKP